MEDRPAMRRVARPSARECARATTLLSEGNITGATSVLDRVLAADPTHGEALIGVGHVRELQGHLEQALVLFDKALQSDPLSVKCRARREAIMLRMEKQRQLAEAALLSLLEEEEDRANRRRDRRNRKKKRRNERRKGKQTESEVEAEHVQVEAEHVRVEAEHVHVEAEHAHAEAEHLCIREFGGFRGGAGEYGGVIGGERHIDLSHELDGLEECSICLEELQIEPVTTGCNHSFCKECLVQHIACNGAVCPLCRADLQLTQVRPFTASDLRNVHSPPDTLRKNPLVSRQQQVADRCGALHRSRMNVWNSSHGLLELDTLPERAAGASASA